MQRARSQRRGFTLIEVMIVVVIFALLMLAIVEFFIKNDSLVRSQMATVEMVNGARAILGDVQIVASQASRAVSSHTFGTLTITSTTTSIVLELPSITASGDVIANTYDYIGYYATGTAAFRVVHNGAGSVRASSTKRLSNSVSSLTFSYNNVDTTLSSAITVDVVAEMTVKNISSEVHERQQVYLRNFIAL